MSTASGCDSLVNVRIRTASPMQCSAEVSTTRICEGNNVVLRVSGDTVGRFRWTALNAASNLIACDTCAVTTAQPTRTTTFVMHAMNTAGCELSDSVTVEVDTLPDVRVRPDTAVCAGTTLILWAQGADRIVWQANPALSCTDCPQPRATITASSVFTVRVFDSAHPLCYRDTSITITALPCVRTVTVQQTPIASFNACDSAVAEIIVRNTGTVQAVLDSIVVKAASNLVFSAADLARVRMSLPMVLDSGKAAITLKIHVLPTASGAAFGDIVLHFRDTVITTRVTLLSTATSITVSMPNLGSLRADTLVAMSCQVSGADWNSFAVNDSARIHVYVDSTAFVYDHIERGSALPADWNASYEAGRSTLSHKVFTLAGPTPLRVDGEWIRPVFRTILPATSTVVTKADMEFPTLRIPCVGVQTQNSIAVFTACVLDMRRIEWSSTTTGVYSVTPNPVNGSRVTVMYGLIGQTHVTISVFSVDGRQIHSISSDQQESGIYKVDIDVAAIPDGQYVVQMEAEGRVYHTSFNVSRK